MLEDVQRHLERRAGDLDVRRPAAELLVSGDGGREHGPAGGAWPRSSGLKPCEGADWHTWAAPLTTASIADLPAGTTEWFGENPSSRRKPPAMVAINGV